MPSKHSDPLDSLRHEHTEALAFAEKIETIAREGDEAALAAAVDLVQRYKQEEMEGHLQHEEQRIMSVLIREHPQQMPLCVRIGHEHGRMRTLAATIGHGDPRQGLAEFATLLREHSRLEDEELYPLVGSLFTPPQLAAILDFEPLFVQPVPVPRP